MSAPCVFHCLDTKMAKECIQTCGEYMGYARKPFQTVPLRELVKFQQPSWENAFREWGVVQLWVGVISAIMNVIIIVIGTRNGHCGHVAHHGHRGHHGYCGPNLFSVIVELTFQIIMAYLMAHLCWYGVVRKAGCCFCLVACLEGPPLLLLWGALAVLWGISAFLLSLNASYACTYCFFMAVLTAIYAVTLFYMGLCALFLWKNHGAEIVPPALEMKGPEGEMVGRVQVA